MKKVFCYLERGLAIGFLVTTVCLLLNEGANETMRQVAVWMVASMPDGLLSLLVYVFPTFLAIYAVIYLSIFLSIWISARRMNRKLRAR